MQTLDVTSPRDGSVLATVPVDHPTSVATALQLLRARQPAWQDTSVAERARWLARLRDHLLWNVEELVATLSDETGKPEVEARVEVVFALDAIRYYVRHAERHLRPESAPLSIATLGLGRTTVHPRAYPLVAVISPWNFPFGLAVVDAVPALLAGAAVAMKPSELTPLSAGLLADAWRAIGAPDVLACLVGDGAVGALLVEEADCVAFTGSTSTGRRIAVRAAERLIPCSLELGGNDAMIVLADADLERAASAAVFGAVCNGGQMCVAVERIYVEDAVHDRFVAALRRRLADLPRDDVTPLASHAQLELVRSHVSDAERAGATVQAWHPVDGTWHPPTLLLDVTEEMRCMQEETFGPVLPVMRVADVDEAIRLANDSAYGLSATVWTRSARTADEVAARLEAGAVNVNAVFSNLFVFDAPQHAWKSSGLGARFGGAHAVRRFCRDQTVVHARLRWRSDPHWLPYTGGTHRLVRLLTAALRRPAARRASRHVQGREAR